MTAAVLKSELLLWLGGKF